jgi:eukaryotic-like serine/threonine-protein kinase
MPLSVGDKLGPYEILAPIGAGGMGEVWKARDTRLDRTVAIKTSKVEFNDRFEREARAVSALNHPHICQLYDVGPNYLVMEFVEGSPLKGPMALDRALALAIQLAGAMDAAHRKGIIHRDLKPGNVLVTKSGVKVLDFGIAKMERTPGVGISEETLTQSPTQEGTILGTLQYMAPEQLQAKEVDGRADIFSFGCVLYEMLTGKRAFDGKNAASVIAAVMERPAPSVCEVAPAALDRVVKRCLEKDPEDRWQTARDLKAELGWIAGGGTDIPRQAQAYSIRSRLLWPLASLLIAAIAVYAGWMLKPAPARPVSRMEIALGPGERLTNLDTTAIAISPDGSRVAYVAKRGDGPPQLFLRPLDELKSEPIAGTEGAESPFFSPDGQWIAFFAGDKLKKAPIAAGAAVTLCDVDSPSSTHGGNWGPNNTILFAQVGGGFLQIPASGGTPHRLPAEAKHQYWRWPQHTPRGGAVLFAAGSAAISFAGTASIAVAALDGADVERELIAGGSAPRLAATGDLIYVRNGTLMAVPFNSGRLELAGTPAPVLEGVRESMLGAAQYSLSASGTLVYVPGALQGNASRLTWVDRAGKEQPIAAPARVYAFSRLSPDGLRIGTTVAGTETQVWVYDMARDALSRATFEGTINSNPIWSPDGKRLAFQSDRAGPANLYVQPADGGGAAERLTTSRFSNPPSSWSPDGQIVAYMENNPETGFDIWTLALGDRKALPFLKTKYNETAPKFSPDGLWLAYASDETGRFEVYVQPYPGPGGKWQVSTEGGAEPVWNPAGHELFYRAGNRMMAVPITLQPGFSMGKPVVLFEGPWLSTTLTLQNYDVSRDGRRFLMLKAAEEDQGAQRIVVVQNWLEELKRRMAAGKK